MQTLRRYEYSKRNASRENRDNLQLAGLAPEFAVISPATAVQQPALQVVTMSTSFWTEIFQKDAQINSAAPLSGVTGP